MNLKVTSNIDIAKAFIGFGDVDNTNDLGKPISTAAQAAINLKATTTDRATRETLITQPIKHKNRKHHNSIRCQFESNHD